MDIPNSKSIIRKSTDEDIKIILSWLKDQEERESWDIQESWDIHINKIIYINEFLYCNSAPL